MKLYSLHTSLKCPSVLTILDLNFVKTIVIVTGNKSCNKRLDSTLCAEHDGKLYCKVWSIMWMGVWMVRVFFFFSSCNGVINYNQTMENSVARVGSMSLPICTAVVSRLSSLVTDFKLKWRSQMGFMDISAKDGFQCSFCPDLLWPPARSEGLRLRRRGGHS